MRKLKETLFIAIIYIMYFWQVKLKREPEYIWGARFSANLERLKKEKQGEQK